MDAELSMQEYLDKYRLSDIIGIAVNAATRDDEVDHSLYLARHIKRAAPSVIVDIKALQIFDSQGNPTVQVNLFTNKGSYRASVPSAVISPSYQAGHDVVDLREHDNAKNRVSQAVTIINNKISGELIGMDPQRQSQIDQALIDLDTTDKKSLLEANAMFAVSMAACKAGAAEKEMPLYAYIADLSGNSNPKMPYPVIPIISGGKHAANNLAAQEIMIIPYQASNIMEAIQIGVKTYHHLKDIISEKHGPTGCRIGKDGGLAPNISSISEGLDLVMEAIGRLHYDKEILPALNISATDFCVAKKYDMDFKSPSKSGQPQNFKTGQEMIQMYAQLCEEYKILSITQPFDKDDWDNTKELTGLKCCQVSGDDLLMSNPELVERAIKESTCNALVLKVNQVGTVTEAIEVVKQAKVADWQVMVSHGSGETDDIFISDLAVGVGASQINAGAPCGEEHMSKYNQLLEIEKCLKEKLST